MQAKRTAAEASLLSVSLDREAKTPLHAQLADQLRRLILNGRLPTGSKLASSRKLSAELSVSRVTVVTAMDQLQSEGYIETRQGSGVFVTADLPDGTVLRHGRGQGSGTDTPFVMPQAPEVRPFQTFLPDLSLFPHRQWARTFDKVWRQPDTALLAHQDPFGWPALRVAIAEHLAAWRGIACSPEQIVITAGTRDAIDLIARSAFHKGDTVLVEDPGYRSLGLALADGGLTVRPVPVGPQGFDIARGTALAPEARGAVVTPSRQFPLGMTLPVARRLDLLAWARGADGLLIEDDYDSEFRYSGAPLPALMSLDEHGAVVYLGSFSKVLSPTFRLGFLVAPSRLVGPIRDRLRATGPRASFLVQPVLARFMAEGHFAAHVRRMRRIYGQRRDVLAEALAERLGDVLEIGDLSAGMHVVVRLRDDRAPAKTDTAIAARALEAGLVLQPLSSYYAGKPRSQGLVLGYAAFDEGVLIDGIRILSEVLGTHP